jgi:uncharacterized protein YcaQ
MAPAAPQLTTAQARRLLLAGQALLGPPAPGGLEGLIQQLGYVQLDSINVVERAHFHKRYDLAERVFPLAHALPAPDPADHLEWACATALERLGVATPRELAAFWNAVEPADAVRWCADALAAGRILRVEVQPRDGGPAKPAFAVPDWQERLAALAEPGERMVLLCPFDPILRDRARTLRLFGFDFRFEAFVPEAKRQFGYYVLPILEGEALVGRIDAKSHRDRGVLEIKGLWWEPGVRPTKVRLRRLHAALAELARRTGAQAFRFG